MSLKSTIFKLLLLILLVSQGTNASVLNKLKYYTEDYPPYNYLDDQIIKGVAVDLLVESSRLLGSSIEPNDIKLIPWPRAYHIARTVPNSVLLSTARTPARENLFKWVGPIGATRVVILAKKNSNIKINNIQDLAQYPIGVVKDDIAEHLMLQAGVSSAMMEYANTSKPLSRMLAFDRFKLWAYEERAARIAIEQSGMNNSAFEVVFVLKKLSLYYAFHLATDDQIIALFQNTLDKLKETSPDSTPSYYDSVLHQYGIFE